MFSRKIITIILFITILLLIWLLQPSLMFNKDGTIKNFGHTDDKSLITIFIAIPIIAMVSYILVLSLELIYT
jgi:hypothetical protein